MDISIINTGGTIGSELSNGVIASKNAAESSLVANNKTIDLDGKTIEINYSISEPYRILSENMDFKYLTLLIEEINKVLKTKTDGIIITHGTDSLAYTAAFLYYIFRDIDIPIVLVSSNFVLTDSRANGGDNFKFALKFIAGAYARGVFVSYKNTNDCPRIHAGNMLHRGLELDDAVFSVKGMEFGHFENEEFVANSLFVLPDMIEGFRVNNTNLDLTNSKRVLMLSAHTGMVYPKLDDSIGGIVIGGYHAGTMPVNDEFVAFVDSAKELNIPIYATGLNSDLDEYETVDKLRNLGVITVPDTPVISLYAQVMLSQRS
ncbi:MAG: asparaginase [Lachnospiraceae bacterium]|nr:asparaginase [Lachnospiraceae bacterium]